MSTAVAPEDVVVEHEVVTQTSWRQRLVSGTFLVLLGLVTIWFLALSLPSGNEARLKMGATDALSVPDLVLPGRATALVLGVVIVLLGVYQLVRGCSRRAMPWLLAAAFVSFMVAFLCWVSARGDGRTLDLVGLLSNSIGLSVPLILGALAGVLCERSGVINVSIEGQMLAGAWAAALTGSVAGIYFGLVGAMVAGALMGVMLALFAIKYLVNQVVLGVVLNVFALGLTGFFYDAFMQPNADTLNNPGVLGQINIPLLSHIPVVGPLLFQANIVVYLTYVLIIVIDVALFRTRWGLRTRAVGEHPKAADTVGIKVNRTRFRTILLAGAIAGMGGAFYTLVSVPQFNREMTGGAGYIALAAVIFGKWDPIRATLAALLFGFASNLQGVLSVIGSPVPSQFMLMLPYVVTIFAVAGLVGRSRAPAADGIPYRVDGH